MSRYWAVRYAFALLAAVFLVLLARLAYFRGASARHAAWLLAFVWAVYEVGWLQSIRKK